MKKLISIFLAVVVLSALFTVYAGATSQVEGVNSVGGDAEAQSVDISDESSEPVVREVSAFEKVFQVMFIAIMSIGLLGLPYYFWVNSKKNKANREYAESNDGEDESNGEE